MHIYFINCYIVKISVHKNWYTGKKISFIVDVHFIELSIIPG